jgi:hypothetical protein
MPKAWEKLFDGLLDDIGQTFKDEFTEFIDNAKDDAEPFISKQAKKLEKYLNQLAKGEITKAEMEVYAKDMETLVRQKALELSIKAKARAQHFADSIKKLLIGRLLALLP